MDSNNSGGGGWKVNLLPSQLRHNLAVEIWEDKYAVDYALLDTREEKINFLKEILGKNKGKGLVAMRNPKKPYRSLLLKNSIMQETNKQMNQLLKDRNHQNKFKKTIVIQNQDLQNKSIMKKSTGRVNKHNWYIFGKNFLN